MPSFIQPRFFSAALLLCLTLNAQAADSYITRLLNKPVPGGVAVIVNEFGELGIDGEILKQCSIGRCLHRHQRIKPGKQVQLRPAKKIGRASCRERV